MAAVPSNTIQVSHAVNNNDHGPIIIATGAVLLVCSCLFLMLRLWMRWPWKGMLGADDICTVVAHVFAIAQTSVAFAAVSNGLGKRAHLLNTTEETTVEKLVYASDLLFVLTTWLSRLAVAMLFLRLCANRSQVRRIRYFVYAVSALLLAALLATAIRQQALTPWRTALFSSTLYRWIAIGTVGIVVEILLTSLSIILVWGLQMQPKDKLRVIAGFAARLIVAIPVIIRLVSLQENSDSRDFTWSFTMPELWTQLEMHLSIIASTIPCLRIFLKSFNTGYFGMALEQLDPTGTVLATKGDSFNMSKLKSGGSDSNPTQAQVRKAGMTTSRITHGREDEDSISERSDRGIFVRQTVNVAYDR